MKNLNLWNNQLCQPVLITYNRAKKLEQTLSAFYEIADTGIQLHILDNASTDETPQIVAAWQEKWKNLFYHRNLFNLGGNANILRALEISQSKYSWIIGDDDLWHLQHLPLLIAALAVEDVDIFRLGWLTPEYTQGKKSSARQLATEESLFFASLGMISSTIIRRSIMANYLPQAYMNIANAYPQLVAPILALQQGDLLVYSLEQPLLTHTPSQEPAYYFGDLEWYAGWFKTGKFFDNNRLRQKFLSEIVRYMIRPTSGYWAEWVWLLKVSLNYKAQGVRQGYHLAELFLYGTGWRFRLLLLNILYGLFPGFLANWLRKLYYKGQGKKAPTLKIDRSRI